MKAPPFLLGAALLFWGWQTGFFVVGAIMAAVIESAHLVNARWEFSDEDFNRTWTFCAVLFLGTAVYTFTASEGAAEFRNLLLDPGLIYRRNAGVAGARSAAALVGWTPMVFFPVAAAQVYSLRAAVPLTAFWMIRRRRQRARMLGQRLQAVRSLNISYPFFAVCFFAACMHPGQDLNSFLGLSVLLGWAFWPQRSRRHGVILWAALLLSVVVCSYFGQLGIGRLQGYLDNYNPDWLWQLLHRGFDPTQSRMALGQIGRVKGSGRIVIRLTPKPGSRAPELLRVASYRTYRPQAQTWYSGSGGEDFAALQSETNGTTFVLLPEKTNTSTINIACYLQGGQALLPLPSGSGRLELNLAAFALKKNRMGAVFAEGPGFVSFDAGFGPGTTIDLAAYSDPEPEYIDADTAVPLGEARGIDQIISEIQLEKSETEAELRKALLKIQGFFAAKFNYSTWQGPPSLTSTNKTPLSRFLLETRSGHCEYFATATVFLLRQLNIPARYAVGYAVHEASGPKYVVRQRDAHAWCLVWNEYSSTWEDFDTTPGTWVEEESKRASPWQLASDGWSWIRFEFSKFRWGQTRVRQYILLALVPALGFLLFQVIFRKRGQRRRPNQSEPESGGAWPGLDSEFYQLERKLTERAAPRQPGEPLSAWLTRAAADPALAGMEDALQQLLRLHYRYRFDPLGLGGLDRDELNRGATACLASLSETKRLARRSA